MVAVLGLFGYGLRSGDIKGFLLVSFLVIIYAFFASSLRVVIG
jgi:hypothetical protein